MMSQCFATDKKVSLSLISTDYSDRRFLMGKKPKLLLSGLWQSQRLAQNRAIQKS